MKISQIYSLGKTQHELDFVDIDTTLDKRVFIDPFFISTRADPWSISTTTTFRKFFQLAINLIRIGDTEKARKMFINLNEPNETCLGLSRNNPSGRGVAGIDAQKIFDSICKSRAVETGLVEDLEDTAIFIENIDKDKVSDMTTNIIREHLLTYTTEQCNLWNIPLTPDVPSGYYWNSTRQMWDKGYFERLVIGEKPILLVPKIAVSFYKNFIAQKYYQHYVLNFLQGDHLQRNTHLVQVRSLHTGIRERYVTKKSIREESPYSKEFIRNFTNRNPEVFKDFKSATSQSSTPISNSELERIDITNLVNHLSSQLTSTESGGEQASRYHSLMIGILEFMLYPNLTNPKKEKEINDGRKRIDIVFNNAAKNGYFSRLSHILRVPSSYIFVECKNYSSDPVNPEIDQLSGRFSVNSSCMGLLVCRKIQGKITFIKRCQDLWKQKRELILPITDDDILSILSSIKNGSDNPLDTILDELQREIVVS